MIWRVQSFIPVLMVQCMASAPYLGPSFSKARGPCSSHSCFETHMLSLSASCGQRNGEISNMMVEGQIVGLTYQVGENSTAEEDHVSSSWRILDADLEFLQPERKDDRQQLHLVVCLQQMRLCNSRQVSQDHHQAPSSTTTASIPSQFLTASQDTCCYHHSTRQPCTSQL